MCNSYQTLKSFRGKKRKEKSLIAAEIHLHLCEAVNFKLIANSLLKYGQLDTYTIVGVGGM